MEPLTPPGLRRASCFVAAWLALAVMASAAPPRIISKLPYTCQAPGLYVLGKNLAYNGTGAAVTINADDVTLDLRGFQISSAGGNSITSETAGIFSNGRSNLTLRHGTIRGFFRGVYLEGSENTGGHLVEDLRVEDSTFLGIQTKGNATVIRGNRVNRVGGATAFRAQRYGIHHEGTLSRVVENEVTGVVRDNTETGNSAYGILVRNSAASSVERKRALNHGAAADLNTYGIAVENSIGTIVLGNQISVYFFGLRFVSSSASKYRDNLTVRVQQRVSTPGDVFDAGGND